MVHVPCLPPIITRKCVVSLVRKFEETVSVIDNLKGVVECNGTVVTPSSVWRKQFNKVQGIFLYHSHYTVSSNSITNIKIMCENSLYLLNTLTLKSFFTVNTLCPIVQDVFLTTNALK
jgi:hypothetical protein